MAVRGKKIVGKRIFALIPLRIWLIFSKGRTISLSRVGGVGGFSVAGGVKVKKKMLEMERKGG